jgi:hypothetical protein
MGVPVGFSWFDSGLSIIDFTTTSAELSLLPKLLCLRFREYPHTRIG